MFKATAFVSALILIMLRTGGVIGIHDVQSCDNFGSGDGDLSLENTTSRCVPYDDAVTRILYNECIEYIPEGKCHFFDYGANYEDLRSKLRILSSVLSTQSSSDYCKEVVLSYACNYVYPGCDLVQDIPLGVCRQECLVLGGICGDTFRNLESVAASVDMFRFSVQCENTLDFVDMFGFNFTDDPHDCFNISDTIKESTATMVVTTMATSTNGNEDLPLEWIIPVSTVGAVIVFIGLLACVIIICWRVKKKRKRFVSLQESTVVRENQTNDYQLRGFFTEIVQECEEVPLFQLMSEDVDRMGNNSNLREVFVPFKHLDMIEEIAEGAFGRVYRGLFARSLDTQEGADEGGLIEVAIKTIKDDQLRGSYQNIKGFVEESALMHSFNHPHVLGLIGISLDENSSPYLILPFMENGDLRSFLKNKREIATKSTDTGYPEGLQYDMLVRICNEIAEGMEYLASRKLVHRDLAARNCMVDKKIGIRVADFGLTRDIYQTDYYIQRQNAKIPVKWMSPESLHDRISNQKTDVWAYGVTCWEVFSLGRMPYPTVTNHEMLDYLEQGKRLKRPALCSDEMYDLMGRCWAQSPGDRPTFTDIVQIFDSYIVPEIYTPNSILLGGYKVKVKTSSPEASLLTSIVTELKNTPTASFHLDLEDGEHQEFTSEILQESYQSIGNSYYVKMNPIAEGLQSRPFPEPYYSSVFDEVDPHTKTSHLTVPKSHVTKKPRSGQAKGQSTVITNPSVQPKSGASSNLKRTDSSSSDYFPMCRVKSTQGKINN